MALLAWCVQCLKKALKNSLTPQISVAKANGFDDIIFVPGKIGENIASKLNLPAKSYGTNK